MRGRGLGPGLVHVREHRAIQRSRESAARPSNSSGEQRCGADGASAQVISGLGFAEARGSIPVMKSSSCFAGRLCQRDACGWLQAVP